MKFKLFVTSLLVFWSCSAFAQWTSRSFPFSHTSYSVQAAGNTLIATGFNDIYKSTDGGQNWVHTSAQFTNFNPAISWLFFTTRVMFVSENLAFSFNNAAGINTILKSIDGGANWTLVHYSNGNGIKNMQWVSANVGYAVGSSGKILKTTNGGDSWTELSSPTSNTLNSLHFLDNNNGVIVGDEIILKTTNGGNSWTSIVKTGQYFNSVFLINSKKGFIKGTLGIESFVFDASGNLDFNFDYNHIAASELYYTDPLTGYFLSSDGLYKTIDGGIFWSQQKNTKGYQIGAFDFYGKNNAIMVAYLNGFPNTKLLFTTTTGGDPMSQNDARLLDVNQYPNNLCRGQYPVKALVINEGINNLTSTEIRWSVNGVEQAPFQWTGNLVPGDTTEMITVGTYDFNRTTRDFNVVVWTDKPNGTTDDNTANDSKSVTYRFNIFNGEYYIGGSNNDFASINEAVQLMKTHGVCDDVVFSFRNGTYTNDLIYISDPIYGFNLDRKLTFQSESGNPNDVTLAYTSNIPVSIYSIPQVSFLNLSITISTTASNISLDRIDSLVFENCRISNSRPESNAYSIVLGYNTKSLYFHNNIIQGGQFGVVEYSGNHEYASKNWIIIGNTFLNQRSGGISFETSVNRNLRIERNKFLTVTSQDRYTALEIESTSETFIANNYFQLTSTSTNQAYLNGVAVEYGKPKIYYNTIVVNAASGTGSTISISRTNPAIIKNNNLVNLGKGAVYGYLSEDQNSIIDNNNLYATSSLIGTTNPIYSSAENYSAFNLPAWQSVSGFDRNSISVDPQLISDNIHVPLATSNYALNGAGTPLIEVPTDIDGDLRDTQTPDIGVDEFDLPLVDLGITEVSPGEVVCAGPKSLQMLVTNHGQNTVESFEVNWDYEGESYTALHADPLSAGSSVVVSLSPMDFSAGTHHIPLVLHVNGDSNSRNDTLTASVKAGGMSGTYTIGGASPNYTTIASAIAAIQTNGVCGNVTFNIRSGTYTEAISIPSVPGASENNQVIFQSEAQDSASVTLDVPSVIIFDGADWVTLRHFTISCTVPGSDLLEFRNEANHNTIQLNRFAGYMNRIGIYSSSSAIDEYNSILSNTFDIENGYWVQYCIVLTGPYSTINLASHHERKNIISGNIFVIDERPGDNNTNVVDLSYQDGFVFDDNHISNKSNKGLRVFNCINQFSISGNRIYTKGEGIGIENSLDYGNSSLSIVSNNIVEAETGIAINLVRVNKVGLYNNTVIGRNEITVVNVNAIWWNPGDRFESLEVKNNIFISKAEGACLALGPQTTVTSNYNVFYADNDHPLALPKSGGWRNDPRSEFYDGLFHWQSKTGHDLNSLFLLPRFVSATDYHILNDYRLKKKGISVGVTKDIDGDNRDASTPDIGADEFIIIPIPNDAGVSSSVRPDECGTTLPIKVKIRNFGSNQLSSAFIHWKVNELLMPTVQWTGTLAPSAESSEITLGDYTFHPSDSADIKIWTELPNNVTDLETLNDTIVIDNIYQKLNGYYSLGGSGTDFPTFKSALDYLHRVGVCGPVTLTVMAGTYNEELKWTEIPGASAQNRITFQANMPTDPTILEGHWSTQPLLKGTDYVTFKELTFSNLEFTFTDECDGIQFISNRFISGGLYLTFKDGHFPNVLIESNYFEGGFYGINAIQPLINPVIQYNEFKDQSGTAIRLMSSVNAKIFENSIFTEVAGNEPGIQIGGASGHLSVQKNKILGSFWEGIEINNSGSTYTKSIVGNNMINGRNSGISSRNNMNIIYAYNSIQIVNPDPVWAMNAFYSDADSAIIVMNNSFVNPVISDSPYSGDALDISGLHKPSSIIDHNNFWSVNNTFRYQNVRYNSFEEYQAVSGLDANSISVDPIYVSSTDLHALNPALNGRGTPVSEVTTDFDGEPRDAVHPDIGADEFVTYPTDAGIGAIVFPLQICQGSNDVYVIVRNLGTGVLGSTKIEWTINGVAQPSFNWAGALLSSESSDSVKIGSFNFSAVEPYEIKVWTSMPNGAADPNTSNDAQTIEALPSARGVFTIGGTNPDYETIQDAVTMLKEHGVCGPVTLNIRPGIYTEQIVLQDIAGSSLSNRITFTSETGNAADVVSKYNALHYGENYVWKVYDQSYVTIKNITIEPLSLAYGTAIKLDGYNIYQVKILNNVIKLPVNTTDTEQFGSFGVYAEETVVYGTSINNNSFSGGSGAILLRSTTYPYQGGIQQDTIVGNQMTDQYMYGIRLMSYSSYLIQDNQIITTVAKSPTYIGMNLYNHPQGPVNNQIVGNKLDVFGTGFQISGTVSALIANNFIAIKSASSHTTWYGMYISGNADFRLFYNSVAMHDPGSLNACIYLRSTHLLGLPKSKLKNNIFANFGGGASLEVLEEVFSTNQFESDHNDWYTSGNEMGRWWHPIDPVKHFATLDAWKAYSGMDAHSLASNPMFVSISDLHAQSEEIIGSGVAIPAILTDIDGQVRHATFPTIGADEFGTITNSNIGIVSVSNVACNPNETITLVVKNLGIVTTNSFLIDWWVDNQPQARRAWNGSLTFGQSITYALPFFTFSTGSHTLKIEVSQPNGMNDESLTTNTFETNFTLVAPLVTADGPLEFCEGGSVTLLSSSGYESFLWSDETTTRSLTVSMSGNYSVQGVDANDCLSLPSAVVNVVVNEFPEATISEEHGALIASLGDSYQWFKVDDAIEGATNRNYIPEDPGLYKVEVTTNGCATLSDGFDFVITGIEQIGWSEIKYFPNPANQVLWVEMKSVSAQQAALKMFDHLGKEAKLAVIKTNDIGFELYVANLESGMYVLAIQIGKEIQYHKISVIH